VGEGQAWFTEWSKLAEKVASLGEQAEGRGHLQTAAAAFMRAANYIQVGERLLQPRTAESQKAYARSVTLFKRGAPHFPFLSIEPVEVPFEDGKSLPAYFIKQRGAATVKWPTVVFFDGLDVTKEMQFFRGVPELVKRGMACLAIDGPGNGESIRFRGMHLRHDYNVAGSAAVDYLNTREDVDKERLGVMGISLGGYYAPRCAAFEKRYKACVAWGAIYDYHATWKSRIEKEFKTSLSVPGEHILWILGVKSYDQALKKLERFTLKGVLSKIACPFLLVHGEADAQITMEDAQRLFDEVGSKDKTFKIFTREEGGSQHCQRDNQTIGAAYITDWFVERLIRGVGR
jgi:dipeptidyl aminopeptidase/acylaminoacyl peptidase